MSGLPRVRRTAWIVLVTSIVLTFLLWHLSLRFAQDAARARFDAQAEQAARSIEDRLRTHELALRGGLGLRLAMEPAGVSREAWRNFATVQRSEIEYVPAAAAGGMAGAIAGEEGEVTVWGDPRGEPRMILPHRRADGSLAGLVTVPLRPRRLVEGILASGGGGLGVEIFEGPARAPAAKPVFSRTVAIHPGDRTWSVRFTAGNGFLSATERAIPTLLGGGGALVVLFLLWTLLAILYHERVVDRLAQKRLAAVRMQEAAFDHVVEGAARLDAHGVTTYVNDAYAEMLGYRREELVGCSPSVVCAEDLPLLRTALARMEREDRVEAELRGLRKDGTTFWMELTLVPICDAAGRLEGHHRFLRDISSRKAAEDEARRNLEAAERLNRVMLGREERILELKEENRGLRERFGDRRIPA